MTAEPSRAIPPAISAALSGTADISLCGDVDKTLLDRFLTDLDKARGKDGDVVLELTTPGGDPELTRRIVLEIDRARDGLSGDFLFLGKAVVYSAGVSIMAAFPREQRFLTREAMLLVHGRQLDRTVTLSGPLRTGIPTIEALLAEMRTGVELEEVGFRRLIEGSSVTFDEVVRKATSSWYVTAEEAFERGLVGALV